jgi:hypothetical protein
MVIKRPIKDILIAFAFTAFTLVTGYMAFGFMTSMIFASGFLTGFLLWLFSASKPAFKQIRWPYWTVLLLFIGHRVEEKISGFFVRLSDITGVPTPDITSVTVILLVLASVGAWLTIPFAVKRGYEFGYYLAWTFFSAMGITELAHFIFPLFTDRPYGYFPGMASVIFLAPLGWWGMYRLSGNGEKSRQGLPSSHI